MAIIQNNTATSKDSKVTKYQEGLFMGVQYSSQEEAVQQGALHHSRQELNTVTTILETLGCKVDETAVLQAIYDLKKKQIVDSIERRVERETIPEGLVL
jgi:hypothetical protein